MFFFRSFETIENSVSRRECVKHFKIIIEGSVPFIGVIYEQIYYTLK